MKGEVYDYQKRRYRWCSFCKPKKVPIKGKINKFIEVTKLFALSDNFCSQCGNLLDKTVVRRTCYTMKESRAKKVKPTHSCTQEQLNWRP